MQPKEFNILLDIKKQYKGDRFEVVQGDTNSNVLNITLVDGINPYNLTGTNVEIVFSKADGTTVQQTDITIINATQGRIQCTLKTNTIASPGKVIAEVRVLEGEILLTSARFDFFVRKALITDDTIESTNEFPILNQLITTTEGLIQQVEQIEKQVPEYIVEAMGDLEDLETEDKSSLVNAINEVNNKSVDLTPVENRIDDLEDDLAAHKADMATKLGRTTFHCTALTGYKIVQSNCFVVNNIAYVFLQVQKNDETPFDISTHNVAQIPHGIFGSYTHLLATGLDAGGNPKVIDAPVAITGWNNNISVRPVDTGATRIYITGSYPIN